MEHWCLIGYTLSLSQVQLSSGGSSSACNPSVEVSTSGAGVRVMPGFAVAGGVILMQSYLQIKFFLLLKHEYLYWEMNIVIFKLLFKRN